MKIEQVPLSDLKPHPQNYRTHPEDQIEHIVQSITDHDFYRNIVIARDGTILAGHGVVLASERMGRETAPAFRVDLEPDEPDAIRILTGDNEIAHLGVVDGKLLSGLLSDLKDSEGGLAGTGYDEELLSDLLKTVPSDETEPPPEAKEPPAAPVSRLGDLWCMGAHRLLCGDSTDEAAVARLLAGETPFIMVTDPPYGVEYEGGETNTKKRKKLAGDEDARMYVAAFSGTSCDVAYAWFAGIKARAVYGAAEDAGFEPRSLLVWNKLKAHYGAPSAHYKQRHESCLYAVRKGKSAQWGGDMVVPTVWDIDQPARNVFHPTQKPVECMARPIRNHGKDGDIVYDPFLGSGTTVIAASQEGRTCYALDIDPAYIDVSVLRWQEYTGEEAKLDGGGTWSQVVEERKEKPAEPNSEDRT